MTSYSQITRREFVKTASVAAFAVSPFASKPAFAIPKRKPTDVRIKEVEVRYQDFSYRAPYEFGGRSASVVTIANVYCTVETISGHIARGFGSMPLGNEWSFPSKALSYKQTLEVMKRLGEKIEKTTQNYNETGHPIDINYALEPEYIAAAGEVAEEMYLDQPIPKLCTLVTASPFDAAIHDAFGKAHNLNCYLTYGPEFMTYDLSHYLTPEFKGKFPGNYLLRAPKSWLWCNHSVGAADAIDSADLKRRINDGLPETLTGWIVADGLTHFKIKLDGNNLDADVTRVLHIDQVVTRTQSSRDVKNWYYSLDFNEQCPNVAYLLNFLEKVKRKSSQGYERITFIEQPTRRDLVATPDQFLFQAAEQKPIVMDEALTGFDALLRARKIGYTGVALKACKGQSQTVVLNAAAQHFKMYMTVQDLTCPGASLVQSAGIAAHVPPVDTLEANAREYVPSANRPWAKKFPGLFEVRDGKLNTASLTGPGLGAVPP